MPGRVLPSWPIMEKRSKCQKHVDSIYDIVKNWPQMARSYAKVVFFKQMCHDASNAVQLKDEKENMTHLTHL